jgi:FMN phosphatase YigB (HAD superfamily)
MIMKRKILILFDVGAVLVRLDFRSFFEESAKIGRNTAEQIKEAYVASNLEKDCAEGQINKAAYYQRVRTLIQPKAKISQEQLEQLVGLMWPGQIDEMVALKEELYKQGYVVGIFSNIADFAYETIERKYPAIFETFDPKAPKILSYQIKAMKPNKPMYEAVATRSYKRVILIDDKDQYLETGRTFGWFGIHFTPYIDTTEPARLMHPDKGQQEAGFIQADSRREVEVALERFGVKL